ncbi:hypothetical protein EDB92DRAFT_1957470 [Lactarius akahatsu]|uniref:Uncharacterized protein n=1 Tax=Lactarius akahatsu TaxID=416441 RepID=A0AAD4L7F1_9AGAM|nr:hypothetical protein EDB92DRAFT_1957470 [Lactarius akahatsu]
MATTTTTEVREEIALAEEARRIAEEAESYLQPINPATGHRMTADDAAIFRAVGPDQPDPPPGRGGPPPRRPFGGAPGDFGGGPPRGGPPDGNLFRPPPPGGGMPGVGAGAPGPDKLSGEPPTIFKGDRADYESFLTQWHLYWGLNSDTPVMRNVYLLHSNAHSVQVDPYLCRELRRGLE